MRGCGNASPISSRFCWFMKTLRLQYLIHGHKHVYDPREVTEFRYCDMWVVNAYGHKVLDI